MKFRAVLFDAAETLFTTRGSVGKIYAGVAREYAFMRTRILQAKAKPSPDMGTGGLCSR